MRVILLTHGGAELVLEKLAALDNVEIVGVFIEPVTIPRRGVVEKIRRSIEYDGILGTAKKLILKKNKAETDAEGAANGSILVAGRLGLKVFEVDNFHSDTSIEAMRSLDADLSVICGANIIKQSVFSIPKLGSINLHQGLAPYYRGGPPIFWELFNGEKEVGITVHFVAAKVDAGDIILQKSVPLEYDNAYGHNFEEFISSFKSGLREESADLIAEAVSSVASGDFERIPQDISKGKRYRLPLKREKNEMRRRLKERMNRGRNAKD